MAGSLNKVLLIGRLGADPEIRAMQSGNKVASFSLATSKRWKDKSTQEQKEKTSWHKVVVFGDGLVDIVEKYVKKGSKIYVEGTVYPYTVAYIDGDRIVTTAQMTNAITDAKYMIGSCQVFYCFFSEYFSRLKGVFVPD